MTPKDAPSSPPPEPVTAEVEVSDQDLLLSLTGPSTERLRLLEKALGVQVGVRGQTLHFSGAPDAVALGERAVAELVDALRHGAQLRDTDIAATVNLLRHHPDIRLRTVFEPITLAGAAGKQISPRGLAQRHYLRAIRDNDIVFGVGPAGTGKTYLAVAMAVMALQEQKVRRIVLTRPAVEAGEKLGFLPGDMADKVDPYLRPLYDALHDMMPAERVTQLVQKGVIEVAPLAFMRGRTLGDAFVILDEAQNTQIGQMKMFLTRLGHRSKAVITGDVTQVDLPDGTHSGLPDALRLLSDVEGLKCCYFSSEDVVRHPLVQRIVEAYDRRDAERRTGR